MMRSKRSTSTAKECAAAFPRAVRAGSGGHSWPRPRRSSLVQTRSQSDSAGGSAMGLLARRAGRQWPGPPSAERTRAAASWARARLGCACALMGWPKRVNQMQVSRKWLGPGGHPEDQQVSRWLADIAAISVSRSWRGSSWRARDEAAIPWKDGKATCAGWERRASRRIDACCLSSAQPGRGSPRRQEMAAESSWPRYHA